MLSNQDQWIRGTKRENHYWSQSSKRVENTVIPMLPYMDL